MPIIERELRVAAHHSKTWWRRVGTLAVGLVVFGLAYQSLRRWLDPGRVGRELFSVVSVFGMVFALLAGPFATVDCLARERREGTLGLLFLTDLSTYDVVLGKMAAAALDSVLAMAALLPLLTISFLLGGINLYQWIVTGLALFQIMFFSLALGICASSVLATGRSALALTVFALLFLTLGLPVIGEELFGINFFSKRAAWFYMACPLYTIRFSIEGFARRSSMGAFWLNLAGLHALSWLCLLTACRRTRLAWRDLPASLRRLRWQERFERWAKGNAAARRRWRAAMLERHPLSWVEGRDRLQHRVLLGLLLLSAWTWLLGYWVDPGKWTDDGVIVPWAVFAHYILCVWLAILAPRRLADDKQSGALELLLCTSLKPKQIIRGSMLLFWRRFGPIIAALLALNLFMLNQHFNYHRVTRPFRDDVFQAAAFGLPVFAIQLWCLASIGLYQGLASSNSLRATFMLLWKICLLPWVLFIASMMSYEYCRQTWFKFLPNITDPFVFSVWAGAHLLACGGFLVHADWHLRRHFRALAAQTIRPPWWKPWRRFQD